QGAARVAQAVAVPVTADLEGGYGPTIGDAIQTARGAITAGAVGLNFEDWDERRESLMHIEAQTARIAAIRKVADGSAIPLVINARTDVFLRNLGPDDAWRIEETVRRANQYLDAGADCAFVPLVTDEGTIATLCNAIHGPLNVLAGPATPTVARLGQLGVARVSVGATAMAYALTHLRQIAAAVKETGAFEFTGHRLSHAEINGLFD
ncbi:MAG: isocitrate lyase/phosphoenolpyruvate mutase family protein, partial [Candidatus Eremiobacteraeota bacterium]|nr:isocitrate lyase/phosphoenolpyruvate mutase family protein [Candidatus Eremiobacteraeota bacterium]